MGLSERMSEPLVRGREAKTPKPLFGDAAMV